MRLESPWMLLLLLLIPLGAWWVARRRRGAAVRFSSLALASAGGASWRVRLRRLPPALRVGALGCLALALARPQEGTETVRDLSKGIAIQMVIDRSSSMSAEMEFAGERTTRLDAVKAVFAAFLLGDGEALSGRPNDLVGMTAFARHAETVCPLTLDHAALEKFLGSIHIVTRRADDGTAIGDAVALAAARLRQAEETLRRQTGGTGSDYTIKSKVLILLTDGQNNAGKRSPEEAAALAAEWGIKIYAIGVGAGASSATVRTPLGRYRVPMGSPMDEATLEGMAEATGGLYLRADDAEGLRKVYETIDRLERTEIESLRHLDYRERFVPLALAALAMLALELLLRTTLLRTAP